MTIYCLLLLIIILTYVVSDQKNEKALFFVFFCIFLISALRAPSVGRDFPGYIQAYEITKRIPFWNFRYIYFEKGYILFMKICAWIGMSNQMFTAFTSFIIIAPVYVFIKKYSSNYMLSTLIYVCYQFFEFDLTGIRQAMAMSICLFAFILAIERNKGWLLKFIIIVTVATFIHKGAFAAFFVLPLIFIRGIFESTMLTMGASLAILVGRGFLLAYIKDFFQKGHMDVSAGIYIGANFIFQAFWGLIFVYLALKSEVYYECEENERYNNYDNLKVKQDYFLEVVKIYLLTIPVSLLFGADTTARSGMFLTQAIIILLPRVSDLFTEDSWRIFNIACVLFFIIFFVINTLIPNSLDIIPYTFFWDHG